VFEPTALLREARRQKGLPIVEVPALCVLDPDGEIVRRLRHSAQAKPSATWPCYHTELYEFALAGKTTGICPCRGGRDDRIGWPMSAFGHFADMPIALCNVRFRGKSGHLAIALLETNDRTAPRIPRPMVAVT
jgi:hypothetical protein